MTSPSWDSTQTVTLIPDEAPCPVLIADDDELVRLQLSALVSAAGYTVKTASSGEEALRLFESEQFRVVLSDWEMPDMDGLALCRNIRSRQGRNYVYLLLLTVRRNKRDIVAGLAAGADDYIVKGASAEELLARLNVGRRITSLERSLREANRENRRMAYTDGLTGARNRRYLMSHLPREFDRSRRHTHSLAVLMCDLDNFKRINDGFGHDAGDQVLEAFYDRSALVLRSSDWIARTGGEEFVVVLPETDLEGASVVAEKIREAVSARPISTAAGPLSETVSIGYTAVVNPTDLRRFGPEDLIRTADEQLYIAKNGGRDRCCGALVNPVSGTQGNVHKLAAAGRAESRIESDGLSLAPDVHRGR